MSFGEYAEGERISSDPTRLSAVGLAKEEAGLLPFSDGGRSSRQYTSHLVSSAPGRKQNFEIAIGSWICLKFGYANWRGTD
jgi:hypothetical protein